MELGLPTKNPPLPIADRSGKRALHVAEEFRFEERCGQRRAIDRHERRGRVRRIRVDRPRDQLLARAALATDDHVRRGSRHLADHLEDLYHLRVATACECHRGGASKTTASVTFVCQPQSTLIGRRSTQASARICSFLRRSAAGTGGQVVDATMDALTPEWPALRRPQPAQRRQRYTHEHHPRCHSGLPASRVWPSEHSVSNHLTDPAVAFTHNPSARQAFWASPCSGRLAERPGRIEFVILRTALSSPVALHLLSRERSYCRLQAGVCMPEEDSHLPDQTRSQAHPSGGFSRRDSTKVWLLPDNGVAGGEGGGEAVQRMVHGGVDTG